MIVGMKKLYILLIIGIIFFGCSKKSQAQAETSQITVTSPNGGEALEITKTYDITWDSENIDQIKIELFGSSYYINGYLIISLSSNPGSYSWTIPSNMPIASDYVIKISDGSKTSCTNQGVDYDESNSVFSITERAKAVIDDITPSQGEQGETIDVVIIGSNFTEASSLSGCGLSPVEDRGFKLSSCEIVSDTKITAQYSIADDAISGKRNITVHTLGGASNAVDFSVYIRTIPAAQDQSESSVPEPEPEPEPAPAPASTTVSTQSISEGSLVGTVNDSKVYVIEEGKKRWIKTAEEFNQKGYKWENIQRVALDVLNAYADYEQQVSLIRAANESKVYKIIGNKKLWIPTIDAFNKMGNRWEDIQNVTKSEEEQYPRLKLVKLADDEKIYYLTEGGYKKYIPSMEVFNSYNNKLEDVAEISAVELDAYPDVALIKEEKGYKVYKLENGAKRWIKTAAVFNKLGFDWNAIAPVNAVEFNSYSEGDAIE